MYVGGALVLTFGVLAVGVLVLFYALMRVLYIPINHVAFIESWTGYLRQEDRPGLHLLRLTEWVVAFPLSWLGGKDKGAKVPYHVIPKTPIRIDPAPWDIVSSDKERMKIDLWMTLRIANPRKFLVETSAHDPAAVLMDQVRMQVVEQCKTHTSKALIASPYPKFGLEDIETRFGVEISMHIESLKRADDIEQQQHNATKAELDRETRHAVAMQEARRVAEIELQRMQMETERSKRAQEMELAKLHHQAVVDAERRKAERAEAEHKRALRESEQTSAWSDLRAAIEAGLTPEKYVEMERIRRLAAMQPTGVSYLPASVHPLVQLSTKE